MMKLGVNVDHVATLRQARGTPYPDPAETAYAAQRAGADTITVHLREDRRHIQERDVLLLSENLEIPLNFEIAITADMLTFAETVRPTYCCLVPEKREELTTEGGLDVVAQKERIGTACRRLAAAGIKVSLFIDPKLDQIEAARICQAPIIELHTGHYADSCNKDEQLEELERLKKAAAEANNSGLQVNAGHGLHYGNVSQVAAIPELAELNIGHSIVARAIMVGIESAVKEMLQLILDARNQICK